jgi:hypothetical protein
MPGLDPGIRCGTGAASNGLFRPGHDETGGSIGST